jgi:hypothetical protein
LRRLSGDVEGYLARSATGADCEVRLYTAPSAGDFERAQREVGLCRGIVHEAVATPQAAFLDGLQFAVVTPSVDGGSLSELVQGLRARGTQLSQQAAVYVAGQIAGALAQAHDVEDDEGGLMGVCHGHLSPEHVTVSVDGSVRVVGLGLSSLIGAGGLQPDTGYAAPEQRDGGRVTPRGDIYSACAILWAILADREPTGRTLEVDVLGEALPLALRDEVERGLAASLAARKITCMELEQSCAAVSDGSGQASLAQAMGDAGRLSSLPPPDSTPAAPPLRDGPPSSSVPPLRSRQATLLGNPLPGHPPAGPPPATNPLAGLGLDEPDVEPPVVTRALRQVELSNLDHTIALEGNVDVQQSPVSVKVPSLDWGADDPTTIKPRKEIVAEFEAEVEAAVVPSAGAASGNLEEAATLAGAAAGLDIDVEAAGVRTIERAVRLLAQRFLPRSGRTMMVMA